MPDPSSGGHFEQLKMLKKPNEEYSVYVVTEKTIYAEDCDYTLLPSGGGKLKSYFRFFLNIFYSLKHLLKEKPDVIISTGTRVAIPTIVWVKIFGEKVIYIETFVRVHDGKTPKKFYDRFIISQAL